MISLIESGTDVNEPDVDGATALHWAVHADQLEATRILLAAGANPEFESRYGVTPLYLAAVNGNAPLIESLLDAGADAGAFGPNGETMLMTAARTGVPEALSALLEAGAEIDVRDTNYGQTALMLAV